MEYNAAKLRCLKSNMDRFIAETTVTGIVELLFKIQYG